MVTVSGGVGMLMADDANRRGLAVPEMPEEAQRRMLELVPFAAARNPIDVTGQFLARKGRAKGGYAGSGGEENAGRGFVTSRDPPLCAVLRRSGVVWRDSEPISRGSWRATEVCRRVP